MINKYETEIKNDIKYSWMIEGIQLSDDEIDEKYELIKSMDRFVFYRNQTRYATWGDILMTHKLLFPELGDDAGRLRTINVMVGGHIKPFHEQLPGLYEEFCKKIHTIDKTYENIGLLHAEFENIHPFVDGNGRVGRLIIPFLCKLYGLEPISSAEYFWDSRQNFYDALSGYDFGNIDNWNEYFAGVLTN